MTKKYTYEISIILFVAMLLLCILPSGAIFGSEVDWYNQHVSIAEHIRQACYSQATLLPDYSSLGGGSNFFMFAYYGVLRPDILLSLLFPFIAMQDILITYSIICIFASCLLCFHFLKKQQITPSIAFICSLLLACAGCFFQAHRQLMFINYIPYLFLLLLSIDTKKISLISISFFALFIHSFFFSITFLIVGWLYTMYKQFSIRQYMLSFLLACGLACCLLLPSALAILEQHKDVGSTNYLALLGMQYSYENMLYSNYGCGLTLISLYSLLICIKDKKTKLLAIAMFILFSLSIFSFLLNGTLYIRTKIYIPFIPLLILCVALTLDKIYKKEIGIQYPILLVLLILLFGQSNKLLYVIDFVLIICFLYLYKRKASIWMFCLLLIIPLYTYVDVNRKETYIAQNDQRKNIFDKQILTDFYLDKQYRFDIANTPLTNANHTPLATMKKTTMYSSTMNTRYSKYYYDIMKTPISIKNRVALLANSNPFLAKMMSVRYLQTKKNSLPAGYEVIQEKQGVVLAENKDVFPIAYVSSSFIDTKTFHQLNFPYTLDTMLNASIVKNKNNTTYTSQMKPFHNETYQSVWNEQLMWNETKQAYTISNNHQQPISLPLEPLPDDTILIVKMKIQSKNNKEVTIDINGIRNRLSALSANYPNHHHEFVYYLSNTDNQLSMKLAKGQYTITNLEMYTVPLNALNQMQVEPLDIHATNAKELLKGSIKVSKDGYFITSMPYQKGYHAYLDGEEVDIEIVNTAFVGFPIKKGQHTITITYEAPGKKVGLSISLIAVIALCGIAYYEERKKKR